MHMLSPLPSPVIHEILTAPEIWVPVAILERASLGPELADAIAAGLVETWDPAPPGTRCPAAPLATLTPLGASRSGACLVEWTEFGRLRWADAGQVGGRWRFSVGSRQIRHPELIPDPLPGPEQAVDDEDQPMTLFDRKVPVMIDRRLAGGKTKKGKKRKRVKVLG